MRKRDYSQIQQQKEPTADKRRKSEDQIEIFVGSVGKLYALRLRDGLHTAVRAGFSSAKNMLVLCKYDRHKIFNLATENKDNILIQYLFDQIEELGVRHNISKSSIVHRNNYALLHKLINILSNDIISGEYDSQVSKNLFRPFASINPDVLTTVINEKITDRENYNLLLGNILSKDFAEVTSLIKPDASSFQDKIARKKTNDKHVTLKV